MEKPSGLDELCEADALSQVVFVQDYIQLVFQNYRLSIYNRVRISRDESRWDESTPGFCDELRRLIGQRATHTSYARGDAFAVMFEDRTTVAISLKPEDATIVEAFELVNDQGLWILEQNE